MFVFGKRGTVADKKTAPKKDKGGAKGEVKDEAKGEEKKGGCCRGARGEN